MGDFSPTAEPPDTEARLELISSSRSDIDSWAVDVRLDPDKHLAQAGAKYGPSGTTSGARTTAYTIYTPEDLLRIYDPEDKRRVSMRALGLALDKAGFRKARGNNGRLGTYRATFWLVKDPDPSRAAISSTVAARMYQQERPERFVPPSAARAREGGQRRVQ
jgi:hypothetical protein